NLRRQRNIDIGMHGEYSIFIVQCYYYNEREHIYRLCMFKNAKQIADSGARSFTVTFQCGIKHQIVDVAESTQCEYTMIFATPLARDEITAKESFRKYDEL
ncbi:unnamed protein product, partial [Rotaria magnacalcarata]